MSQAPEGTITAASSSGPSSARRPKGGAARARMRSGCCILPEPELFEKPASKPPSPVAAEAKPPLPVAVDASELSEASTLAVSEASTPVVLPQLGRKVLETVETPTTVKEEANNLTEAVKGATESSSSVTEVRKVATEEPVPLDEAPAQAALECTDDMLAGVQEPGPLDEASTEAAPDCADNEVPVQAAPEVADRLPSAATVVQAAPELPDELSSPAAKTPQEQQGQERPGAMVDHLRVAAAGLKELKEERQAWKAAKERQTTKDTVIATSSGSNSSPAPALLSMCSSPRAAFAPTSPVYEQTPCLLSRQFSPLSPKRSEENYEISDKDELSDEEDEEAEKERRRHKHVPRWCQNFLDVLKEQSSWDPDSIFGSKVQRCDIDAVFTAEHYKLAGKDKPKRARGSSQNWAKDRLRSKEVENYKKKLGQTKPWAPASKPAVGTSPRAGTSPLATRNCNATVS